MLLSIVSRSAVLRGCATTCSALRHSTRKPFVVAATTRSFGMVDQMRSKEKVEEDLYIREQEKKFFEKKKAQAQQEMAAQEMAVYMEAIAPAMVEAQELLKKSNDKVSDAGLEALARWKLDMK